MFLSEQSDSSGRVIGFVFGWLNSRVAIKKRIFESKVDIKNDLISKYLFVTSEVTRFTSAS